MKSKEIRFIPTNIPTRIKFEKSYQPLYQPPLINGRTLRKRVRLII